MKKKILLLFFLIFLFDKNLLSKDDAPFILNAEKHQKDKKNFPEYTLWYSKNKELMKFKFKSTKDNKIIQIIRKIK